MCECLGCSGCKESRKCQAGKCNCALGRYQVQKHAKRCHWCYAHIDADTTNVPVVVTDADTTHVSPVVVSNVPVVLTDADTNHVSPVVLSTSNLIQKCHTWSTPLTVRLLTDSVGRLKSKAKDYIHEVQTQVASQGNIILLKEIFPGGDLPEIADYFEKDDCCSGTCDLNFIILMPNCAASTLGQHGISDPMVRACHRLQKVAESVPTYVIYGGPGEMWPNVVRCGGQNCFDTKAKHIRELLASSGHIKVKSGADDFRAFFAISDLDDIGHIKGLARGKAIQWLAKQVMAASNDLGQVMQPNVQHGLAPVNNPLATKFALIGFPPLDQVEQSSSLASPHTFK